MKIGFYIVFLIFFGLTIGAIQLTKGLIYRYVTRITVPSLIWLMTRTHIISAVIIGLFLPNNYLNTVPLINTYYQESGVWIGISIFVVFFLALISIGLVFNILLAILGFKEINYEAYQWHLGSFNRFIKAKLGLDD